MLPLLLFFFFFIFYIFISIIIIIISSYFNYYFNYLYILFLHGSLTRDLIVLNKITLEGAKELAELLNVKAVVDQDLF